MVDSSVTLMMVVFMLTILFMLWRPFGINEVIPTTIGAGIILITGIVSWQDVSGIVTIVSGPAITILSTIMMSIVLESIGFFRWIAYNIIIKSKNSGTRLYIYTNLLCFFTTMLFNNDGSILITTPIIIHIVKLLRFKPHQIFPYLISGALIATAASAPIAVSNISNLIALKMIGLSLNSYVNMMFVPSMIGICIIALLLYLYFHKELPKKITFIPHHYTMNPSAHPLSTNREEEVIDWQMIKICLIIVVATRTSFFVLTPLGISIEWIGLVGALILIAYRWMKTRTGIIDIVKGSPWHIFLFAFNMYVLVYGLQNVGFNDMIIRLLKDFAEQDAMNAAIAFGVLSTVLSNVFNNLPAVMIGTFSIMDMDLSPLLLQIAYLANVLGSDIGALLTPIGTLATLIWMFILKKNGIHITWGKYLKVTVYVIPIGLIVSLFSLYAWTMWLFE
ncbi:arsenic transporter [Solibacillus sp. FSL H8-0538]|uniref:arsenic transporter n=1 Tax=Solibacillus sp. FSL H8-0538 TaxID=2921400 RepID=UPI0030FB5EF6